MKLRNDDASVFTYSMYGLLGLGILFAVSMGWSVQHSAKRANLAVTLQAAR